MLIHKQLIIKKEHFGDTAFRDIIYNYLIKKFNISSNDFDLF